MKLAIVGAGSVGLVLGARLARSGSDVVFVTRRREQAECLGREGVSLEDPATGASFRAPVRAFADAGAAVDEIGSGPALFCVRAGDVGAAAAGLAIRGGDLVAVGAQNGVESDGLLARHFPRVLGLVVRLTCTRTSDAAARALAGGRLVLGAYPDSGSGGDDVTTLAAALRGADFDVGLSPRLAEDRWLKLCVNLLSAPNALVRRSDHATHAFVELKARLLEEAREVLGAAKIPARSCDGRDRSLEQEIAHQRASLAAGSSARELPLYNQVWTALRSGGSLEADGYHQTLLELAREHGTPAPHNARMLEVLRRCWREGTGPESVAAAELLVR